MLDEQSDLPSEQGFERTSSPVPAARPLEDFSLERVGDDVVLFDPGLNRYHTLNEPAFRIWRLCDGSRSAESIASSLDHGESTVEFVRAAIEQLGESGLLQAPEAGFASSMHRRHVIKLVAAGAVGAVGIPVVASITRLGPEASATPACVAWYSVCSSVGSTASLCSGGGATCLYEYQCNAPVCIPRWIGAGFPTCSTGPC